MDEADAARCRSALVAAREQRRRTPVDTDVRRAFEAVSRRELIDRFVDEPGDDNVQWVGWESLGSPAMQSLRSVLTPIERPVEPARVRRIWHDQRLVG